MGFDSVYEMTDYLKPPTVTPTVTVSDDFSSTSGWTQNDSAKIGLDTSNDKLDFNIVLVGNDNAYRTIPTGSTTWVMRYLLRFSTISTSSGSNIYFLVDISNDGTTAGNNYATGSIGLYMNVDESSNNSLDLFANGASPATVELFVPVVNTDYYVEIIKTSATTATATVGTDAYGGTANGGSGSISGLTASTAQDTFAVRNRGTSSGSSGHSIIGYIKDFKYYNGVTSILPYPKPRGQHFWEYFSGDSLNSRWTERNGLSGDGTVSTSYAVMADEVNGGVKISSNTGTWGKTTLSFNGKRQFDATASVMTFIGRRTGHSVGYNITGLSDHLLIWDNAPQEVGIKNYSEDSSFKVITSDGTQQSETDFNPTVAIDTNSHNFQIVNTSTSNSGYIDGVLGLSKTTNRPTGKLQPQMLAMTKAAEQASAINQIYYIEVYNT